MHNANRAFENDLFYIFNNLNIRHNNIDPALKGNYKSYVAQMPKKEMEKCYDAAYQMCLLAFLQMENYSRKSELDKLKSAIESSVS